MIDPHHHIWDMTKLHFPWLESGGGVAMCGDFTPLCKNYLLSDYLTEMGGRVEKSVAIQADHDEEDPVAESRWLQSVADDPTSGGFPHGIVAFADFTRDDVIDVLRAHSQFPNVRGVRQIVAWHEEPFFRHAPRDLVADPAWRARISLLKQFGLSFDFQLYPPQMPNAAKVIADNPETLFFIDHTGSPIHLDRGGQPEWRENMRLMASFPNTAVKISGLGMFIADWNADSLRPIVLEAIEIFGVDRSMFASNYPTDSLASPSFGKIYDAFEAITADFSTEDKDKLFSANAARLYRL